MAAPKFIFKSGFNKEVNKNFYKYYMFRNSSFMYLLFFTGIACLILIIFQDNTDNASNVMLWSISLLGIVFMPMFTIMNARSASKKDYEKRKDVIETYEITKEKIQRNTNVDKVAINWNLIAKVVEVNDAYYFFTIHNEAFTISKEGLIDGNILEFRKLINNCLVKTKKGKIPFIIKEKEYLKAKKASKGKKK